MNTRTIIDEIKQILPTQFLNSVNGQLALDRIAKLIEIEAVEQIQNNKHNAIDVAYRVADVNADNVVKVAAAIYEYIYGEAAK